MPNERLRSSIIAANLSIIDLATHVGVDPKTVERWVTKARIPHRTHRWATASLLNTDEAYLWPDVLDDVRIRSASEAEFLHLYPHRGALPPSLLPTLFERATDAIEVLVYSGLFLPDSYPDLAGMLMVKASTGTKVRILAGDPDSAAVARRGDEEGIGDGLAARIRLSLGYLALALEIPGVDIRLHATTLYASVYRLDEDMLVNIHTYGAPAAHNPVIHLRRVPGGRLFGHYLASFDRVWATANPVHHNHAVGREHRKVP
jgi:hypothetical protein